MTVKSVVFAAIIAALALCAGCAAGTAQVDAPKYPALQGNWREIIQSEFKIVAANSGLEYRDTPIEFLGLPEPCSAPALSAPNAEASAIDLGNCSEMNVTVHADGVERTMRIGFLLREDGFARFFNNQQ